MKLHDRGYDFGINSLKRNCMAENENEAHLSARLFKGKVENSLSRMKDG